MEDRVFPRLRLEGDCWIWIGTKSHDGYGQVQVAGSKAGTKVYVHRWVYEYLIAEIPEGLQLDHLCKTPPCANPWHLEPVPGRVNVLRGDTIAARNAAKTHCPRGHAYEGYNLIVDKLNRRFCRTCRNDRARAKYAQKTAA